MRNRGHVQLSRNRTVTGFIIPVTASKPTCQVHGFTGLRCCNSLTHRGFGILIGRPHYNCSQKVLFSDTFRGALKLARVGRFPYASTRPGSTKRQLPRALPSRKQQQKRGRFTKKHRNRTVSFAAPGGLLRVAGLAMFNRPVCLPVFLFIKWASGL